MGTRSFADVAPTAATIALNAYIFGYGGHSLVTPHAALKQLWWTDERINAKITRNFVLSKLRGQEREFLDRPLAFGEGLTDDTYMEWIMSRAKRLFLILAEIGVPDQIFGCIDDSWDDDDLPVSRDDVQCLELAYENDETLNKKFYDLQFIYLLRELKQGSHIDYGPKERIPMEYVNTLPPAVALQTWDRVHFPGRPDDVFTRRKYSLAENEVYDSFYDTFMKDIRLAQGYAHEHIASVWGSYTTENSAYVLSDFVGEHTLGTFIDHRTPVQFVRVPALERSVMLCEWMHCLADALAFLHHRGRAHTSIRPSSIIINSENKIAFADIGSIRTFQRGKKTSKAEAYDYASPESQISRTPLVIASSPPVSSIFAFNRLRKMSSSTSSSSNSSTRSSGRHDSFYTAATSPASPTTCHSPPRIDSLSSLSFSTPRSPTASARSLNFSRHIRTFSSSSTSIPFPPPSPGTPTAITAPTSPTSTRTFPAPTTIDPDLLSDLPHATPEMSDIFSLGCVYLDIITFLLQGKRTDFIAFRTTQSIPPASRRAPRRHKTVRDKSFHAAPERIDGWIQRLEAESTSRTTSSKMPTDQSGEDPVFSAIPALLNLIRRMMLQNAVLRPTAAEVRDGIQAALREAGVKKNLCCTGREWTNTAALPPPRLDDGSQRRTSFGPPFVPPEMDGELREGSLRSFRRRSSASAAAATLSSLRRVLTRGS